MLIAHFRLMWRRLFFVMLLPVCPLIHWWIVRQERRISEDGQPLSPRQTSLAAKAGVRETHRLRALVVDRIPMPGPRWVHCLAQHFGYPADRAIGMSARYGIYVRKGFEGEEDVLIHECVHTAQYERLGIGRFIRNYVYQCLVAGYRASDLEREAVEKTGAIIREDSS